MDNNRVGNILFFLVSSPGRVEGTIMAVGHRADRQAFVKEGSYGDSLSTVSANNFNPYNFVTGERAEALFAPSVES